MEWWLALTIIFGSLVILLALGLPVAFSFLVINLVGVYILWGGEVGLRQLALNMFNAVTIFSLLPIPFFILMGELMFQTGMGQRLIDIIDQWLGALPGRLSILAVASGTAFATLSGSTFASCAMLGSVLVPEMEKRGYKKPLSIGPILGSGGLAMLIPPSSFAVFLAAVAYISIGKLLMAGIIPGLIMAIIGLGYIVIRSKLQPHLTPLYKPPSIPLTRKIISTALYILPMGLTIFLVVGVIFLGVATPSEAAAGGFLGCLILAAVYKSLTWKAITKSFQETVGLTGMILIIMTGATAFSQILATSGAARGLIDFVSNFPVEPIVIIIAMQIVVLILGCFMEANAITMIAIPIFMPIVEVLGFNPLWFGVLFLINIEIGLITPPFGMLLFIMKGVTSADTTMGDIYRAALPFAASHITVLALTTAFPILGLWLPGIMS